MKTLEDNNGTTMKVYIVMSSDGEDRYVEKVFTTKELAQNYINQQNDWY